MKTRIHVNKQKIASNRIHGTNEPVITCKTYKSNDYGNEAIIYGQDGKEAARVIYIPDKPLSCGARLWIETDNKIQILNDAQNTIRGDGRNEQRPAKP